MTEPILPPLKPIPIKDRVSILFVEKGNLDVLDGAFVVVDKNGVRTAFPTGVGMNRPPPLRGRGLKRISVLTWQPGRISRIGLISCEQSDIGTGGFCGGSM